MPRQTKPVVTDARIVEAMLYWESQRLIENDTPPNWLDIGFWAINRIPKNGTKTSFGAEGRRRELGESINVAAFRDALDRLANTGRIVSMTVAMAKAAGYRTFAVGPKTIFYVTRERYAERLAVLARDRRDLLIRSLLEAAEREVLRAHSAEVAKVHRRMMREHGLPPKP